MMKTETQHAPLGIIASLSTGFGAVAQKPALLLIPLLLDLFLWLGPRLSIKPLASRLVTSLETLSLQTADQSTTLFQRSLSEIMDSYNLFSALSTWPLGTPSLLAGDGGAIGPLGTPRSIQIHDPVQLFAWLVTLTLVGLLVGCFYLSYVARWTLHARPSLATWVRHTGHAWARILLFVCVVLIGAFLVSVPFFITLEVIAIVLQPLATLGLLLGTALGMWILFHLFFAVHAILLERVGVSQAVLRSATVVRRYRLSTVGLLLLAVVMSLGLGLIWNLPPAESWLELIAIVGNAFVNTGLVAATFVFYQERAVSQA